MDGISTADLSGFCPEQPASCGSDDGCGAVEGSLRDEEIDRYVGGRIRLQRCLIGQTQQLLARRVGISYQQVHKYERGLNRVSAGRLFRFARALGVPVSFFFEGLSEDDGRDDGLQQRIAQAARHLAAIENERHREALSVMARALATR